MTFIDAHVHLPDRRATPRSFITEAARSGELVARRLGLRMAVPAEKFADQLPVGVEAVDLLQAEMDNSQTDGCVVLMPDFSFAFDDCELSWSALLELHLQALAHLKGQNFFFCGIDPRGPERLATMERFVLAGKIHGYKVYPPCGVRLSDPSFEPFWEFCAAHRLPVLLHMGPTSPAMRTDFRAPEDVDFVAHRFPRVNFILAHASVSQTEDCIALARMRTNVYLDISGFNIEPDCFGLKRILTSSIFHKVLYGTDFPVSGTRRAMVACKSKFEQVLEELGCIGDKELGWITSENLFYLLPGSHG